MRKKIILFLLIFLFAGIAAARADSAIVIDLAKTEFSLGDKVDPKIKFTNYYSSDFRGILTCAIIYPENEIPPFPNMVELDLRPNESAAIDCGKEISEDTAPGLYTIEASVRDSRNKEILKDERKFSVIGTKKTMQAELQICADSDCQNRKIIFTKNEPLFAKINANIKEFKVQAELINKNTQENKAIEFKDNLIKIENLENANYLIKINITKEGYVDFSAEQEFAVIEKPVKIIAKNPCQVDGRCAGEETEQNCPQDCVVVRAQAAKPAGKNYLLYIFIALFLIVTVLMIVLYYKTKEPKDNLPS